jgi:hypothetical protein
MGSFKSFLLLAGLLLFFPGNKMLCQEPERIHTVFTSDARFGYLVSPGFKLNSVFNRLNAELDIYGGLLVNKKTLIGAAAGLNMGYSRVKYEYFGVTGQYIYKPENFIHYSWQTMIGYGLSQIKDETGSGTFRSGFYMIEPGVNVEINLMRTLRLLVGVSYRFVPFVLDKSGYDLYFTNRDLSGLNLRIGIVAGYLLAPLK